MGIYLNPGSESFEIAINSQIYVDKTGMLEYLNKIINTEQRFVCVSRARRFGKTMALNMLAAYYGNGGNACDLFSRFKVAKTSLFTKYANQYDVLRLNMLDFLNEADDVVPQMLQIMSEQIIAEVMEAYPECKFTDQKNIFRVLSKAYAHSKRKFVILIDEWDCLFREKPHDEEGQKRYLNFLRDWLKDKEYVALAYMTGILPIKKYGKHSALNMFREFSMENAGPLTEFTGFTDDEVKALCDQFGMDYDQCKAWYDGYRMYYSYGSVENGKTVIRQKLYEIYSPWSIVEALTNQKFANYWNKTETYEALKNYIMLNMDGLKDTIISLLAGNKKSTNVEKFSNDMATFKSVDDVLALLVHLGYLAYDSNAEEVFIPNNEVRQEFLNSIEDEPEWKTIVSAIEASNTLLRETWNKNDGFIADALENAHFETSNLQYNDENALSYVVSLAYYTARSYYSIKRELPAGKGFADMAFIPLPQHVDKPAMLVELKWDETADTALQQIKNKMYVKAFDGYHGKVLLVGVSYCRDSAKPEYKTHSCVIEEAFL